MCRVGGNNFLVCLVSLSSHQFGISFLLFRTTSDTMSAAETRTPGLPAHLASKASAARERVLSQLPAHTLLSKNLALPLDSTTLIDYSGRLKSPQLEILSYDATALVAALAEKKWTAVEVVQAYAISASVAHQATNCLTWYDVDSALQQAEELDRGLLETGEVVGPLHGVVISIKRLCSRHPHSLLHARSVFTRVNSG